MTDTHSSNPEKAGIMQIQANHLEIAARVWAAGNAREIAGLVVDNVLNQTDAKIPKLATIEIAQDYMERFLTAWLKDCTVEFVRQYDNAMSEYVLKMERLLNEAAMLRPPAPIIIAKGYPNAK